MNFLFKLTLKSNALLKEKYYSLKVNKWVGNIYQGTVCIEAFHDSFASKKTTTKRTVWNYSNAKFPECTRVSRYHSHTSG
jgi:hypothetical protein